MIKQNNLWTGNSFCSVFIPKSFILLFRTNNVDMGKRKHDERKKYRYTRQLKLRVDFFIFNNLPEDK